MDNLKRSPRAGNDQLESLADVDRVVHSPARLSILGYLYVAEAADFTFLMNEIGLTRGNLSSHMSTLEEAGYIAVEKEFVDHRPMTLLRLTKKGRSAFRGYRRNLKRFLDSLPDD